MWEAGEIKEGGHRKILTVCQYAARNLEGQSISEGRAGLGKSGTEGEIGGGGRLGTMLGKNETSGVKGIRLAHGRLWRWARGLSRNSERGEPRSKYGKKHTIKTTSRWVHGEGSFHCQRVRKIETRY